MLSDRSGVDRSNIVGVILAGGHSRRMGGGDKALLPLCGRPLLTRMIDRFVPQVAALAISANGDPSRFSAYGLPVIADHDGESLGPLAGILAGMRWAEQDHAARWVATVPVDVPFVPLDLVSRLRKHVGDVEVAIARSRYRSHPVIGLWEVCLADDLAAWIDDGADRKVEIWVRSRGCATVDFNGGPLDPFFNVNTPEDLTLATRFFEKPI